MDYTVSEHSASTPKNSSGWPLEKVKNETEQKADPSTNIRYAYLFLEKVVKMMGHEPSPAECMWLGQEAKRLVDEHGFTYED